MALNTLTDYGLMWLVALAGACLLVMLVLVLLILVNKLPGISAIVRHTLLRVPTLNGRLSMGFFIVGVLPALLLPPLLAVTAVNTMQNDRIAQLSGSATAISGVLNPLIDKLASGVTTLSNNITDIGQLDKAALGDWLLRYHRENPEFVSTWVAKPDGRVIAATGAADGVIAPWDGPKAGVAMLDTFAPSVAKRGLYVSSVQKGVAPRFDPMMVISAPIFSADEKLWGVVQAQANLRQLYADFIDQAPNSGLQTLITDARNRVLLSSQDIGLSQFEDLSAHPLLARMAATGGAESFGFRGTLQEFSDIHNFAVAQRALDNGWRVFVIASQADIERQGAAYFGMLVVWMVIALILARSLSRIHSTNVADSLKQLEESLHIFDAERTISLIPSAPKYAPREVQQVYNRVRESMRKSRDAYRDLRRAVTEGEDGRRTETPAVKERRRRRIAAEKAREKETQGSTDAAPPSWQGRIDSVTQLSGVEVFEEFFGEAWVMGGAESRPLSLVVLSVIPDKISEAGKKTPIEDSVIKVVATTVRGKITRTLDLVARIDADKFGVVLPDTNLEGALAVANKLHLAVSAAIGEDFLTNAGAVTIVPNPDGNARSFINLAQRALQAAEKQGGEVTFFNSDGQIMLLEEHMTSDTPEDALTIRSGTVTVKNIDDPEAETAAAELKQRRKADKAKATGRAPRKAESTQQQAPQKSDATQQPRQEETTEETGAQHSDDKKSLGTHVLEWDGGY